MSQTASTLADVLREAWTGKTIAKQWFADDQPLKRFEQIEGTQMGKQVQVGIWSDLNSGGFTSTSAAGGALNTASNQGTDQALYTLTQMFMPISLEFSALNQASGSNLQALIGAKNLEVEGAVTTLRNQSTRMLVTNGDGIVAQCGTTSSSSTVALTASPSGSAYGYDAIVRNWLRPGAVVDIGTSSDTDSIASATTVSAVAESASAPTITIGSSVSTTSSDNVYIANPNSATAANPELNGLRNLVNTSGAIGGVNPSTAGEEFWAAAQRDTSTSVFSLDLALNLQRAVQQKSGKTMTDVWTGLKQQANFYSLLQNQVRFPGELKLGAGDVSQVRWNNMEVTAYNAILDSDWWCLTLSDFVRITGAFKDPVWMSELQGAQRGQIWNQGNTNFTDAVGAAFQIGIQRRNTHAGATALTA